MNIFSKIWEWIKSLFGGGSNNLEAIKIGDHVYMPLFYMNLGNKVDSTWEYLAKSDVEKKHLINYIKSGTVSGETPAIAFLLTPSNCNGGLINNQMTNINEEKLTNLVNYIKELVENGIAVLPCLYADDSEPRWFNIKNHIAIWNKIHDKIKHYISGYILSIETNEYTKSLSQLEDCINTMKNIMPGVEYYGTHLQWHANNGSYAWLGSVNKTTPKNVNMLLVENSWDPHKGDAVGLQGMKNEYTGIKQREPTLKLIIHEYNLNPSGNVYKAQKEWLRTQKPFGVG